MSHWLEDGVWHGLEQMDVEEALAAQAAHFGEKGEWSKGVISPSLVGTSCPLARVKIFLGLTPIPYDEHPKMAVKAGKADAVSLVNMVRGFDAEGMLVEALKRAYPEHILATAPKLHVEYFDNDTGWRFAGHPDVFMRLPHGGLGLVQIKSPRVFKLDRIEKYGDKDALETYGPQMATELYIMRKAGYDVTENNLLVFSWDGSNRSSKPRLKAITMEWDASTATIPEQAAEEIYADAAKALMFNQWPKAFPTTSWDVWPCGYCRFARLGDFDVPACDDHDKWRSPDGADEDRDAGRAAPVGSST